MELTFLQISIITVLSILIVVSLFFLFLPRIKFEYASKYLNKIFNRIIFNIIHELDYYLIPQVIIRLPGNDDVIIDHLVFGDKFIYAIKDLYFQGGLLGKANDKEWQYYSFKQRKNDYVYIPNPFHINKKRIEKLSLITGLDRHLFISIILVNNEAIIDRIPLSNDSEYIINIRNFEKLIKAIEARDVPPFKDDVLAKAVLDIASIRLSK
jgi:hypothetical protein